MQALERDLICNALYLKTSQLSSSYHTVTYHSSYMKINKTEPNTFVIKYLCQVLENES